MGVKLRPLWPPSKEELGQMIFREGSRLAKGQSTYNVVLLGKGLELFTPYILKAMIEIHLRGKKHRHFQLKKKGMSSFWTE